MHNRLRKGLAVCLAAGAIFVAEWADAAVVSVGLNGFELKQTVSIGAPAERVYAALIQPGLWWSSDHTFSGDAKNLTLDARAGGCFCETLPKGGSVRHLTVVMAAPGEELDLRGAMGPFLTRGVDGGLSFTLTPTARGVDLTMTNDLGGYMSEGFGTWAAKADAMLAAQLSRLKSFVETGKATSD